MTNYSGGRQLEYEIKSLLEANGWDVLRGAGSKGKVIGFDTDLVASKTTTQNKKELYIVLIQCKRAKI